MEIYELNSKASSRFPEKFSHLSIRLFGRDEFQAHSVDAVTFVGRRVVAFAFENMTEVAIAFCAVHFDADRSEAGVFFGRHVFRLGGIEKRWPSATRIEFLV